MVAVTVLGVTADSGESEDSDCSMQGECVGV